MDCAILAGPGGKPLGRLSFPNSAEGVDRAARWAARVSGTEAAETHVVVEATAAYHELAAHRLAAAGVGGSIGKPAGARRLPRALGILRQTAPVDTPPPPPHRPPGRAHAGGPPAQGMTPLRSPRS